MERTTFTASSGTLLTGMFRDRESADRAYHALMARGYKSDEIYLLMSDETRDKHFAGDIHTKNIGNKAMEGAGTGSAIGMTLGAIAAAIAVVGTSIIIPGLGLVIAGPLVAAAAGAGAGGLTGGIIGALVGAGIPQERAVVYERGIREGHVVLGVRVHSSADAEYIENEWLRNNVLEIHH
jgi:hypothetical protein